MSEADYNRLLQLDYNDLFGLVGDHYLYEKGELKAQEIISKINQCQQITDWLLPKNGYIHMTETVELMNFVNSLSFLIFETAETTCIVALVIAIKIFDQASKGCKLDNEPVTRYLLELIYRCEKFKFIKTNTFFRRLYIKLLDATTLY